jgi:hypothetical protein
MYQVNTPVVFQYGEKTPIRGIVQGYSEKHKAYYVETADGKKILAEERFLSYDPTVDEQKSSGHWTRVYVNGELAWEGVAYANRIALERAASKDRRLYAFMALKKRYLYDRTYVVNDMKIMFTRATETQENLV